MSKYCWPWYQLTTDCLVPTDNRLLGANWQPTAWYQLTTDCLVPTDNRLLGANWQPTAWCQLTTDCLVLTDNPLLGTNWQPTAWYQLTTDCLVPIDNRLLGANWQPTAQLHFLLHHFPETQVIIPSQCKSFSWLRTLKPDGRTVENNLPLWSSQDLLMFESVLQPRLLQQKHRLQHQDIFQGIFSLCGVHIQWNCNIMGYLVYWAYECSSEWPEVHLCKLSTVTH